MAPRGGQRESTARWAGDGPCARRDERLPASPACPEVAP
jgi:hypothetical protein